MTNIPNHRRAMGLVLALIVMTLVGTVIAMTTAQALNFLHERRHTEAAMRLAALLDSGEAYLRVHEHAIPEGHLALPTEGLLPANGDGELTLTQRDDMKGVTVVARVVDGSVRVEGRRFVPWPERSTRINRPARSAATPSDAAPRPSQPSSPTTAASHPAP